MDQLLAGITANPVLGALDLQSLNTGETYGQESRMTPAEMQKRMQEAMNDRDRLARLDEKDFKIQRSEVETQFASLYAPLEVERLEKPVIDRTTKTSASS
jgi:hypothetical protein